jgi:hypothetical protein
MMKTIVGLMLVTTLAASAICYADPYDTPPIVNSINKNKTLSSEELFTVFTSTQRWDNGLPVVIVLMPRDSFPHIWFVENYLGIGKASYQRRLDNAINSGRIEVPIVVNTNAEMIERVGKIEGAIGYLDGDVLVFKEDSVIKLKVTR